MRPACVLYLHDDRPEDLEHGPRGATHRATVELDSPAGVDRWIERLNTPDAYGITGIVRVECPQLGRLWLRHPQTGLLVEKDLKVN